MRSICLQTYNDNVIYLIILCIFVFGFNLHSWRLKNEAYLLQVKVILPLRRPGDFLQGNQY